MLSVDQCLVPAHGTRLLELSCLREALEPLVSCRCGSPGPLELHEDPRQAVGLFSALRLICCACRQQCLHLNTSRHLNACTEQVKTSLGIAHETLRELFGIYQVPFVDQNQLDEQTLTFQVDDQEVTFVKTLVDQNTSFEKQDEDQAVTYVKTLVVHVQDSSFGKSIDEQNLMFVERTPLQEESGTYAKQVDDQQVTLTLVDQDNSFEKSMQDTNLTFVQNEAVSFVGQADDQQVTFVTTLVDQQPSFNKSLEDSNIPFTNSLTDQEVSPFVKPMTGQEVSFTKRLTDQEIAYAETLTRQQDVSFTKSLDMQDVAFTETIGSQQVSFEEPLLDQQVTFEDQLVDSQIVYTSQMENQQVTFTKPLEEPSVEEQTYMRIGDCNGDNVAIPEQVIQSSEPSKQVRANGNVRPVLSEPPPLVPISNRRQVKQPTSKVKCSLCLSTFQNESFFKKHKCLPQCPICGRSFKKMFNLNQHRRTHTGEKPYLCPTCGKSFGDASTLNRHQRGMHTTDRPLKCSICGKRFYHQGHLKVHARSHTGERPYSCNLCGKSFAYPDSIKKHMASHSEQRNFHCETCGRTFRWRESLRQHLKTHKAKAKCKQQNDEQSNKQVEDSEPRLEQEQPLGEDLATLTQVIPYLDDIQVDNIEIPVEYY